MVRCSNNHRQLWRDGGAATVVADESSQTTDVSFGGWLHTPTSHSDSSQCLKSNQGGQEHHQFASENKNRDTTGATENTKEAANVAAGATNGGEGGGDCSSRWRNRDGGIRQVRRTEVKEATGRRWFDGGDGM
ncbi:hypothetical protein E3N88_09509 [Mikania micrantha]|uniref:Uncharacterized protein n=1 Tax=Mikania micrantha TaxID=192012 RepID=A0A5N6PLJ2_9ASTR|nr:hypothetical protein E3N88_09509 [Mikania micrantha]